jgi:hypothetical protein
MICCLMPQNPPLELTLQAIALPCGNKLLIRGIYKPGKLPSNPVPVIQELVMNIAQAKEALQHVNVEVIPFRYGNCDPSTSYYLTLPPDNMQDASI